MVVTPYVTKVRNLEHATRRMSRTCQRNTPAIAGDLSQLLREWAWLALGRVLFSSRKRLSSTSSCSIIDDYGTRASTISARLSTGNWHLPLKKVSSNSGADHTASGRASLCEAKSLDGDSLCSITVGPHRRRSQLLTATTLTNACRRLDNWALLRTITQSPAVMCGN